MSPQADDDEARQRHGTKDQADGEVVPDDTGTLPQTPVPLKDHRADPV